MRPDILRRKDNVQLSFNLPHRIYETCVYPRRSSNGSTIIIYSHENGLRIVWYGGRKFKNPKNGNAVNGDSISLIDSPEDEQEYEDGDEDHGDDTSSPCVLTYLDIPLGMACTRLTIPPFPSERLLDEYPSIFDSHIVVALAGADQSMKLVAVPLQPRQQQQMAGIQVINIVGTNSHQDLISDLAITMTADLVDEEESAARASSRSDARLRKWSFLLASASPTGHGLIVVHQIPVDAMGHISTDPEDLVPIQRHYLRASSAKCRLKFNTSMYPAERHSQLLVTMANNSSVKIFNLSPQQKAKRRRRGSTATTDSSISAARSIRSSFGTTGRPLITLLTSFAPCSPHELSSKRKQILDAAWVLQGRAVIALMEDGEWGIWDLEAAGPVSVKASNNLVKGQGNVSGIHGGSLTRFAINGNLNLNSQIPKSSTAKSTSSANTSLAPMTPHTRKVRSEGLFRGSEHPDAVSPGMVSKGSVEVNLQVGTSSSTSRLNDEVVLFSYGSHNILIQSIQEYWRAGTIGRTAFNGSSASRPVTLPLVITAGEEQTNTHLLHCDTDPASLGSAPSFVVSSASRLVISIPSSLSNRARATTISSLPMRLGAARPVTTEQTLLESGELDIDGMDRMLDSMADTSTKQGVVPAAFGKKSVNFQFNEDEDEDMSTPTLPKSAKSKLLITKGNGEARRLFT